MNGPSLRAALVFAASTLAVLHAARTSDACATVQRDPRPVGVDAEEALIVWDAEHHVEHFIRTAEFDANGVAMGFIVPTPARPELAALPSDPFPALNTATWERSQNTRVHRYEPGCGIAMLRRSREPHEDDPEVHGRPGAVQVQQQRRIGPYEASVLSADDVDALTQWLASHGFASRPALTEWLRPYVDRHWTLTAFRIAPDGASRANRLPAVQMSFATDRPFYPYSEPNEPNAATPGHSRTLTVYVVADRGYEGGLGEAMQPWAGRLVLAASAADEPDATRVIPALAAVRALGLAIPANAWLSAFRDTSSPRVANADLYFRPRESSAPVRPQTLHGVDYIHHTVPIELALLVVGAGLLVWRVRGRRRS